jgi:hypothetical protein
VHLTQFYCPGGHPNSSTCGRVKLLHLIEPRRA